MELQVKIKMHVKIDFKKPVHDGPIAGVLVTRVFGQLERHFAFVRSPTFPVFGVRTPRVVR